MGLNGPDEVKKHPWFKDISWQDLDQRKIKAPYIPSVFKELLNCCRKWKIISIQDIQTIVKKI